jgi:hypothetical protein
VRLTFLAGNILLVCSLAGSVNFEVSFDVNFDVNLGGLPMSFGALVSRLSVVTAYVAFAFVGAIVLGVF